MIANTTDRSNAQYTNFIRQIKIKKFKFLKQENTLEIVAMTLFFLTSSLSYILEYIVFFTRHFYFMKKV